MNVRTACFTVAALCVSSSTFAAEAAPKLGDKGNFVIGAERLFGVTATTLKSESEVGGSKVTQTTSHTNVALLWTYPQTVHNIPRLGFDYLVIPNLSLGLAGGFFSNGSQRESTSNGNGVKVDGPSINMWLVAPRVGYVLDLGDTVSLWLRGGVSFYGASTESEETNAGLKTTSKLSQSGTAFNFEPSFVFTPVPHFGLYGGLALDVPLGGKSKLETTSGTLTRTSETDYTQSSYGAVFGLLGYL